MEKRARFKNDPGGLGGWVFRSLLEPGLEATMRICSSNRACEGREWGGNVIISVPYAELRPRFVDADTDAGRKRP